MRLLGQVLVNGLTGHVSGLRTYQDLWQLNGWKARNLFRSLESDARIQKSEV